MPSRALLSVLLVSLALCVPSHLFAQSDFDSIVRVFGGYSGYRAGGTVNGVAVPDFTFGWAGQVIFRTGEGTGIVTDVSGHYNSSASATDFAIGPRLQHTFGRFVPFVEILAGAQHYSPKGFPSQNAPTYIFGTGTDVKVNSRFSIRPFQLSYVSTLYNSASPTSQSSNYFNGTRVQAGVVYNLGVPTEEGDVIAVCTAAPSAVDAGAPVTINVAAKGFVPRRILSYSYSSTGGLVSSHQATARVDTNDLEAGSYTITANVADNAKRKHHQTASCQATFGVKAKSAPVGFAAPSKTEPSGAAPGISAPSNTEPNKAVPSGAEPTKTAPSSSEPSKAEPNKVTEPSNNAPSGTELSVPAPGNAEPLKAEPPNAVPSKAAPTSATPSTPATSNPAADSAGASVAAGTRGATASTPGAGSARASESNAGEDQPPTASVSVAPNALKSGDTVRIAQPPQAERFGSIDFQHDVKRPTRVDNMAKGELDRYADALAASPDSRGVVVGYATARENAIERSKRRPDFAARRAVNTKGYLSRDKGIDPARIQPRAGHGGKNAELWVVPAGATVPEAGTAKVNEAKVKAVPRVARKADTTVHKKQIGK